MIDTHGCAAYETDSLMRVNDQTRKWKEREGDSPPGENWIRMEKEDQLALEKQTRQKAGADGGVHNGPL